MTGNPSPARTTPGPAPAPTRSAEPADGAIKDSHAGTGGATRAGSDGNDERHAAGGKAGMSLGDLCRAAQDTWRAEPSLTGAQLAARFGRKPRWGREQIATARRQDGAARHGPHAARRPGTTDTTGVPQATLHPWETENHDSRGRPGAHTSLASPDAARHGEGRGPAANIVPPASTARALPRQAGGDTGTGAPPSPPGTARPPARRDAAGNGMPHGEAGTAETASYQAGPGTAMPTTTGNVTWSHDGTTSLSDPRGPVAGDPPTSPGPVPHPGTDRPNGAPRVARSRDDRHDPAQRAEPRALLATTVVSVAVVTVVCAVVSYNHVHDLATLAGQEPLAPWLPFAVDGLVAASTCSLLVDKRAGRHGHPAAWAGALLGIAGSFGANLVAVDPTLADIRHVRWALAGYVPTALAISGHLLLRMLGETRTGSGGTTGG